MVSALFIPEAVLATIASACRQADLHEACGLLGGIAQGAIGSVRCSLPLMNEARAANRFWMSPQAVHQARQQLTALRLRLIGCYHSHPTFDPVPSQNDITAMRQSQMFWLIHSRRNGRTMAYRWTGTGVQTVPLHLR